MAAPPTDAPCGDDFVTSAHRTCTSPADACDWRNGWRVCGSSGSVSELSDFLNRDLCYRSFYGRFSAGLDHCHATEACDAPNKNLVYSCSQFKTNCDSPFCCGTGCTGTANSCSGGVLANGTRFVPGLHPSDGCSHINAAKAGGVLCCCKSPCKNYFLVALLLYFFFQMILLARLRSAPSSRAASVTLKTGRAFGRISARIRL